MTPTLAARGIGASFGPRPVLRDFDLEIAAGDFVALRGPSGCGKSTLLRLFAGLLNPDTGVIERQTHRPAVVFQEPRLLPWRTVAENVALPFELRGEKTEGIEQILTDVGLAAARDLFPHQLSGGMKQRAALARALVTRPDVLLLDEPFSALDETLREGLQVLLRDLWTKSRMTVLFVTHSTPEASFLGERVIEMDAAGRLIKDHRRSVR